MSKVAGSDGLPTRDTPQGQWVPQAFRQELEWSDEP